MEVHEHAVKGIGNSTGILLVEKGGGDKDRIPTELGQQQRTQTSKLNQIGTNRHSSLLEACQVVRRPEIHLTPEC